MNLFFEESGDFKAGTVLTQQGEAFQVETLTGKRSKVRARDVLLQFDTPSPGELISRATSLSHQMDVSFLWEVAGEQEFGFVDLGYTVSASHVWIGIFVNQIDNISIAKFKNGCYCRNWL